MFLHQLNEGVETLARLGQASRAELARMGIQTCAELLQHYPVSYLDRQKLVSLAEAAADTPANTVVQVVEHQSLQAGRRPLLKVIVDDGSKRAALLCFNRPFLARQLIAGQRYFLYGQFQQRYGELQSSQFDFESYSEEPQRFNCILPIYRLAGRLKQQQLRSWIAHLLDKKVFAIEDEFSSSWQELEGLQSKATALRQVHFPDSIAKLQQARYTLVYGELFHLLFAIRRRALRSRAQRRSGRNLSLKWQQQLCQSLSFELTSEQRRVLAVLNRDLAAPRPMQRLLHGDVGCGKTIVALLSALPVLEGGEQVVMMAPTEVLARQLHHQVESLLNVFNLKCAYLSAQLAAKDRQQLRTDLAAGQVGLVVATHAVFSEDISFKRLGLVIIDEQHRFGVVQRLALLRKGENPDLLLMSATPIPRTLALTVYSALSVSSIRSRPTERRTVITHLAEWNSIERVYAFVEAELQHGRQAYFIYPRIDGSTSSQFRSIMQMVEELQRRFVNFRVGSIHGQMKDADKVAVMEDFRQHRLDVLSASTVIEVGVDVANATVMVIDHAPQFGLAQLHQLRGRVGRGKWQSYCFLIYPAELSEDAKKRLLTLKETADGFKIAEADFNLRGPGDILGTQQSGYPALHLADLRRDTQLLQQIRRRVFKLLQTDPNLSTEKNQALQRYYQQTNDRDLLLTSA